MEVFRAVYRGWGAYGGVTGLRYFRRCNGCDEIKEEEDKPVGDDGSRAVFDDVDCFRSQG